MKKLLVLLVTMSAVVMLTGSAHALQVIGTANYLGNDYNLVYEVDNNGNSLVWLDYTRNYDTWQNQVDWAAGLDSDLTITLYPGYTVSWAEDEWRLPTTVDGEYAFGWDGTTTGGFNITSGEMGHLYYESLENLGFYAIDGTNPQTGWGLNNTGPFNNLYSLHYWSDTDYSADAESAWTFYMYWGDKHDINWVHNICYALAVRHGNVSADVSDPVPEPATMLLLGFGLMGLAGLRRKF